MAIRKEAGKTVIYGAQLNGNKPPQRVCKIDTEGKILLEIPNATTGEVPGGWGGLTAVTVAPDGSIFAATGYGANIVHKFDAAGKLLKSFGSKGADEKQFNTPHGLAIDTRFGDARLLVADREKRRLVHFDLEGNWMGVHAVNLRRPCSISILGETVAVAELEARVTILDKTGTPVAFLGDNPSQAQWANFGVSPQEQQLGIFTAPHGLSFDKSGNLYVQDWNKTGRITKLMKR
jgi:DNA-binding beta-propeller fold protein YncE